MYFAEQVARSDSLASEANPTTFPNPKTRDIQCNRHRLTASDYAGDCYGDSGRRVPPPLLPLVEALRLARLQLEFLRLARVSVELTEAIDDNQFIAAAQLEMILSTICARCEIDPAYFGDSKAWNERLREIKETGR